MDSEFEEQPRQKSSIQGLHSSVTHIRGMAEKMGWVAKPYGKSVEGIPLLAWYPTMQKPEGILFAAIHGEESQTILLAHQLMREISAKDSNCVIIPVFNPDGVLHGTRQNARGVDLNRNFPSSTWRSEPSPTFPPFTLTRYAHDRNQISSPGSYPASEPEISAFVALSQKVNPSFMIGLHAPDECILSPHEDDYGFAAWLAELSGLEVVSAIPIAGQPVEDPGSSNYWARENGIRSVSYEIEVASLPEVWHRHRPSLIRAIAESFD